MSPRHTVPSTVSTTVPSTVSTTVSTTVPSALCAAAPGLTGLVLLLALAMAGGGCSPADDVDVPGPEQLGERQGSLASAAAEGVETADAGAAQARSARFRSLTDRTHITDLALHDGNLFVASTGGVDVWTLTDEGREPRHVAAYGAEHGLPGNAVRDLHVEGDQLLAAGIHGLSVWTGQGFETLRAPRGAELPHLLSAVPGARPMATAVLGHPAGRAEGGFDGVVSLTGHYGDGVRSLAGRVIALVDRSRGSAPSGHEPLWAVTTEGVFALGRGPGFRTLLDDDITAASDASDGLWLGFADGRVARLDAGERLQVLRAQKGPSAPAVTALLVDGAQVVLGTSGQGLVVLDRSRGPATERTLGAARAICANHVAALAPYRGDLALGLFDEGLCLVGEGGIASWKRSPHPLPSDLVLSLGTSGAPGEETLWVGTSYGVARLDDHGLSAFAPGFKNRYGLSAYGIVGAGQTDEHLFIADGRGVSRIQKADEGDVTRFRDLPGLPEGLTDLVVAGPHVWAATEERGVSHLDTGDDGETWKSASTHDGLAEEWVVKVAAASDGRAWAGHSLRGVSYFDGEAWRVIGTEQGLPDGAVVSLAYDDDRDVLWVGTLGGLAAVDGRSGAVRAVLDGRDGLPDPRVHAILVRGEELVVGTEGGLGVARIDALLDALPEKR